MYRVDTAIALDVSAKVERIGLVEPTDVYRAENARPADWVMIGNHDTPPVWRLVEEWAQSGALGARRDLLATALRVDPTSLAAPSSLVQAMLAELFLSPARNVMVFFADLFGSTEIYNEPGVVSGENWRLRLSPEWRARYDVDRRAGRALDVPAALAAALRAKRLGKPALIDRLRAEVDAVSVSAEETLDASSFVRNPRRVRSNSSRFVAAASSLSRAARRAAAAARTRCRSCSMFRRSSPIVASNSACRAASGPAGVPRTPVAAGRGTTRAAAWARAVSNDRRNTARAVCSPSRADTASRAWLAVRASRYHTSVWFTLAIMRSGVIARSASEPAWGVAPAAPVTWRSPAMMIAGRGRSKATPRGIGTSVWHSLRAASTTRVAARRGGLVSPP